MKRLIKNNDIILDGTLPRYKKEQEAYNKLEKLENVLEKYAVDSIEELEKRLSNAKKKIYLAKALSNNSNCLGYIVCFNNGKCTYQNVNDLGLDYDAIDTELEYVKKIYIYKRFYAYYIVEDNNDDGTGIELELAKTLLKGCYDHILPLTEQEKKTCEDYWGGHF